MLNFLLAFYVMNSCFIRRVSDHFPALCTIGFGDMVPRKSEDLTSGIQALEYVLRGIYLSLGLCLVSSVVCAVVPAVKMFDRWDVCGKTSCEYSPFHHIAGVNFPAGEISFSTDIARHCDGAKKDSAILSAAKSLVEVLSTIVGKINDF